MAAALVLALAAYAYLGSFSRYMADDFDLFNGARSRGFLAAQIDFYRGWSGRYSFALAMDLCCQTGPRVAAALPALLLAAWLAATTSAVHRAARLRAPGQTFARSLMLAALALWATLEAAPNVAQSLYWQSGSLTYVAPLVVLSLYASFVGGGLGAAGDAARPPAWRLCCCALLTFAAGGFSEAYLTLQAAGLLLAVAFARWRAPQQLRRALVSQLGAGLVGALLALVVVAAAPGNGARQAHFAPAPPLLSVLAQSTLHSGRFAVRTLLRHPHAYALPVLAPLLAALGGGPRRSEAPGGSVRRRVLTLVLLPPAVVALCACCAAPAFYGMSQMLPERARILLSFTLACGAVAWGLTAGACCRDARRVAAAWAGRRATACASLALTLLIAVPVASCVSIFGLRGRARAFAEDWDRQDEQMRAAKSRGETALTVEQIGDFQSRLGLAQSELHLRTDPGFWINRAVARYYGVNSVAARQEPINSP